MKRLKVVNWQIALSVALLVVSVAIYCVYCVLFRDERNLFSYLLQNLAFIPIQVPLVTLILFSLALRTNPFNVHASAVVRN